jgi:hypothetical protein
MSTCYLSWIPHDLSDDLQEVRVAKYHELLDVLKRMQRGHFRDIMTGDESWSYLDYQHSAQWSVSRDNVPKMSKPALIPSPASLLIDDWASQESCTHRKDERMFNLTAGWG